MSDLQEAIELIKRFLEVDTEDYPSELDSDAVRFLESMGVDCSNAPTDAKELKYLFKKFGIDENELDEDFWTTAKVVYPKIDTKV